MDHRYIECEAFTTIVEKKDCAWHKKLGWSKTDWHTHNRGQLVYAEYGIMRLSTDEAVYYIPSWHAAWIPQGINHKLMTESQDLLFYTLYLDHETLTHPFYQQVSIFPVNSMLREMIVFTKRWQLNGLPDSQETNFLNSIKYLLPDLCTVSVNLHVPVPQNEKLLEITSYIEKHFEEKQKVVALARQFGVSERTMHRLFLKELGMSFIQYQKLVRMVKAVELLSVPGKNVSEVAMAVGYESIPSFTRSFKEIMGNSPGKLYREN